MKALRICAAGVFAVYALLVFTGCSKSPTGPGDNQYGNTANGSYFIYEPNYMDSVLIGSTISLSWVSDSTLIGTPVVIAIYKGDNHILDIGTHANSSDSNTIAVLMAAAIVGSGSDYHFRISSATNSLIYDMGFYFRVYSTYNGSFTVTNPPADTSWTASTSSYVRWTYTGTPGNNVTVGLYYESSFVCSFTTTAVTANLNSYVTIPANVANGNRYRIMVSSSADRNIYAYSDYFTVQGGTAPDSYEYDGRPDSAKTITTDGVAQSRNLTRSDSDFVKFTADSGATYTMQTTSLIDTYMYLYYGDGTSLIDSDDDSGVNNNALITWTCTVSGTYYIRIRGFGGTMGAYSLTVTTN